MSKHYKILVILLITVLLPIGCKVGPKYSRPVLEKNPQSYANQAADANVNDSVANVKWFDIFRCWLIKTWPSRIAQSRNDRT